VNAFRIDVSDERPRALLQKAPGLVERRLDDAIARGAEEVARLGRDKAPKAFSILVNSIHAIRVGSLHYQVVTGTNYARHVEEGRAPGIQPGTANGLMEWVKQKTGLTGTDLDRRTFVVARAIGRKGIRPQSYMRPAAEEGEPIVRQLARAAVASAIEEARA